MGRSEVDAALERLVSQFASPYDFLRELVQNSMDAGSERVEVSMERHLEAEALAIELASRSDDFHEINRARRDGRDPDLTGR